jgi:hypothetical protein
LKNKLPAIREKIIVLIKMKFQREVRGSEIIQDGADGSANIKK